MADAAAAAAAAAESGADAQITFKVKTSADGLHVITIAENATVLDLKTKLSSEEFENIPVERQRLIYSGRVMKNDETLATYKIKHNNTIHMVKSAASNQSQPAASSTPTPQAVPSNMASGTANNPLAGLTGARYAGHQINLPGMDAFGPDGGMGPPMDEERVQSMLSDPNIQQTLNEALRNPDFVSMLIDSHPMIRRIPNAREILSSPLMRHMMSDPQMMAQAMRSQRAMQGAAAAFPAPGATDTTPEGAAASNNNNNINSNSNNTPGNNNGNDNSGSRGSAGAPGQNHLLNPFLNPFMMPGGDGNPSQLFQQLSALGVNPFGGPDAGQTGTGSGAASGQDSTENRGVTPAPGSILNPANPFSMLFPPTNTQGGTGAQANPFGVSNEEFQRMMQMLGGGGGGGAASPPADNRPPEERYAEQLRQLNDMGFCDFERNVAALRRSGGSVQGAIEHLLSS